MSETTRGISPSSLGEDKFSSRRSFLGKAGKVAAGGIVATSVIEHEQQVVTEGITTPSGIFHPIYERHDIGIAVEDIPKDLDILYREEGNPNKEIRQYAEQIVRGMTTYAWKHNDNAPEILQRMAKEKVMLMYADVGVTSHYPINSIKNLNEVETEKLLGYGILSSLTSTLANSQNKIDRRKVLGLSVAAGAWLTAPSITDNIGVKVFEQQNKAVRRLDARLSGIVQDFHPELLLTFFRSALMADKLLTVAENQQQSLKRKPHMAYWVGFEHSSIEDFLSAGHDVCRKVLLAYPHTFLHQLVEKSGGIHDVSSALLFQLDQNITSPMIHSDNAKLIKSMTEVTDIVFERELATKIRK